MGVLRGQIYGEVGVLRGQIYGEIHRHKWTRLTHRPRFINVAQDNSMSTYGVVIEQPISNQIKQPD